MESYNLIAMDMDGTVLNSKHEISIRTRAVMNEILNRGKYVVFATGRCLAEMKEYVEEFPAMRYLICENGACIYDLQEKKEIYRKPVSRELTEQVIRTVENEDVLVSFFIGNKAFMNAEAIPRLAEYGLESYVEVLEKTRVRVQDLFAFYRDNPLEPEKITIYFKDSHTRTLVRGRLERMKLQLSGSIGGNLEITDAGVSKGLGLQKVCELLQISLKQTIAIGDGYNDKEMLTCAGLGVAMENAGSELKRTADCIAPDCDHDGVAFIMEKYML